MSRRGFSLVELAVVLTLTAVLLPAVYVFSRTMEDRTARGLWHLEVADGVRAVAEELRRDAHTGEILPGGGLAFTVDGCEIRYQVEHTVLVRQASDACGGDRGLATRVQTLRRVPGGLELVFVRALRADRPHRSTVFLPLETP